MTLLFINQLIKFIQWEPKNFVHWKMQNNNEMELLLSRSLQSNYRDKTLRLITTTQRTYYKDVISDLVSKYYDTDQELQTQMAKESIRK